MKLAILSDIHANLHALQAVWADLETQWPDAACCPGDLVGCGAASNCSSGLASTPRPTVENFYAVCRCKSGKTTPGCI